MKKRYYQSLSVKHLCLLFALGTIFYACSSPTSPEEPESPWWEPLLAQQDSFSKDTSPLEMSLTLSDHKLSVPGTLKMTLDIYNAAEDSVHLTIWGTSSEVIYYDFVVLRPDTSYVWSSLYANYSVLMLSALHIPMAPNETLTFEENWQLITEQSNRIEKGTYQVFGGFPSIEYSIGNYSSETFDIGPVATEMQEIVIE